MSQIQHVCMCRRVKGQLVAVGPQLGGLAASVAVATLWLTRRGRSAGAGSGGGSDGGSGGGGGGGGGDGGDGGPPSEAAKVRLHLLAAAVYSLMCQFEPQTNPIKLRSGGGTTCRRSLIGRPSAPFLRHIDYQRL